MEEITTNINFRLTAALKNTLNADAQESGLDLSNYLKKVLFEDLPKLREIENEYRKIEEVSNSHGQNTDSQQYSILSKVKAFGEQISSARFKQIKEDAIKQYKEDQLLNRESQDSRITALQRKVTQYESPELNSLFDKVKGQMCEVGKTEILIITKMDLVRALVKNYTPEKTV
jgi:hypothetical protein